MGEVVSTCTLFRLWGDALDPDLVTHRLGITPTQAGAKGTVRKEWRGRQHRWPSGGWFLGSTRPDEGPLEEHLIELLDQLHPNAEVIQGFLAQGFKADFFCGVFPNNLNAATSLTPGTLRRIADLGANLLLDIYDPIPADSEMTPDD
jgi:hypothetical protein